MEIKNSVREVKISDSYGAFLDATKASQGQSEKSEETIHKAGDSRTENNS